MFSNSSGSSETMLSLFVSLYSLISATYCSSFIYRHVKAGRDVDLIWIDCSRPLIYSASFNSSFSSALYAAVLTTKLILPSEASIYGLSFS